MKFPCPSFQYSNDKTTMEKSIFYMIEKVEIKRFFPKKVEI